jgi:hypothetical protein
MQLISFTNWSEFQNIEEISEMLWHNKTWFPYKRENSWDPTIIACKQDVFL